MDNTKWVTQSAVVFKLKFPWQRLPENDPFCDKILSISRNFRQIMPYLLNIVAHNGKQIHSLARLIRKSRLLPHH